MIALKKDNFFKTTLASGISGSAVSMTLQSGDAARLTSDGPYRMVLWGAAYTNPGDDANAEIVEAIKDSGEAFDIIRAKEGTTAQAWSADDNVALTATAGTWREVEQAMKEFALCNLTERAQSIFTSGINAVACGGGIWIAVGDSGKLGTSSDGMSWTGRTSSFGSTSINDVAYDGSGRWVAVGDTQKLATSDDNGVTWTQQTMDLDDRNIAGIAHDDSGLWVAACESKVIGSCMIITSPDGVTWTDRGSAGFGLAVLQDIAYGVDGLWVAVSLGGLLATSPDGINWTQRTSQFGSDDILAVTHNGSIWAAVGDNGKISTSEDGMAWTLQSTETTAALYCVTSGHGGMLVAAGESGTVVVSHDGETWGELSAETNGEQLNGIAWDGHKWVLASESDTIRDSLRLP